MQPSVKEDCCLCWLLLLKKTFENNQNQNPCIFALTYCPNRSPYNCFDFVWSMLAARNFRSSRPPTFCAGSCSRRNVEMHSVILFANGCYIEYILFHSQNETRFASHNTKCQQSFSPSKMMSDFADCLTFIAIKYNIGIENMDLK